MLAELAGSLTDFLGLCLRGAYGRNAKGQPDPDSPTNRWRIFAASTAIFVILAAIGASIAMLLANSFTAVWGTAAVILCLGAVASFRAAFA